MLADIGYDVDFAKADAYEAEMAFKNKGIPRFNCGHISSEPEIAIAKKKDSIV